MSNYQNVYFNLRLASCLLCYVNNGFSFEMIHTPKQLKNMIINNTLAF